MNIGNYIFLLLIPSKKSEILYAVVMRYYCIIHLFLAASMSLFIFPATRRIRCHAFRPIAGKADKNLIERCHYECHNWVSEKVNHRCNSFWSISSTSTRRYDEYNERYSVYESVSAYLFRQGKTWKRLSHLLEMAVGDEEKEEDVTVAQAAKKLSIADIGTDHGLLAMGLALTGNYNTVVGVDISDQALTYGALAMLENIRNQTRSLNHEDFDDIPELPVEYRLGNGLEELEVGEADIICIAGMGVNTMLQILEQKSHADNDVMNLKKIKCKRLVLQATNSRPRNLIRLYDRLQNMGWKVKDERIEKLSSRWYITVRFELPNDVNGYEPGKSSDLELPGLKLRSFDLSNSMRNMFDEYCLHHKDWIQKDAEASSQQIDPRDIRWLECFFNETMKFK